MDWTSVAMMEVMRNSKILDTFRRQNRICRWTEGGVRENDSKDCGLNNFKDRAGNNGGGEYCGGAYLLGEIDHHMVKVSVPVTSNSSTPISTYEFLSLPVWLQVIWSINS